MAPSVSHQMLLSCECFATFHTVIRSLRFNAHVKFDVPVEVLPPGVGLGTSLVGAVQEPLGVVRSVVCLLRGLAVRAVPGHRGVAAGGRLGVGLARGVRRRGGVVSVGAARQTVTHLPSVIHSSLSLPQGIEDGH